jgi:hypothetical protein
MKKIPPYLLNHSSPRGIHLGDPIRCGAYRLLIFLVILAGITLSCNFTASQQSDGLEDSSRPVEPTATDIESLPPAISPSAVEAGDCTYFVTPGGDDGQDGDLEHPWASFEQAAQQAVAGDVVCFFGGIYVSETIQLTHSGEPGRMITFTAYPGDKPMLDGQGGVGGLLVFSQGVSYIRLSGFGLRGFSDWGIELSGSNRQIHLDHLHISGGEASIRLTYGEREEPPRDGPVEGVIVEDSLFQGPQFTALDCTPGPCNQITLRRLEVFNAGLGGADSYGADGIAIARGRDIVVEECYVHDNGGDGIDLNSRDRQGNISGVVVTRNRVVRNHLNGIKIWAGGRIENNLVWGQGNSALWVGTWDSTIEIINNTIAYNMWDPTFSGRNWVLAAGYPEDNPRPVVDLTLVNNIFAFNADPLEGGAVGIYLGPGVQLTESHNLYFSRADGEITAEFISGRDTDITRQEIADGVWNSLSGSGVGDLVEDPLFLSPWPDVDLHLQPGSPAIDASNRQYAPAVDLEGNPRREAPDLGAYEMR